VPGLLQAIRKSFLALFTKKALATYVEIQDAVIRQHMSDWFAKCEGQEFDVKQDVR
jgi:cytochrome P450